MTEKDASQIMALAAALWPGKINPTTARTWAAAIQHLSATGAVQALHDCAAANEWPTLAAIIQALEHTQRSRATRAVQIPARATADAEQETRSRAAREIACEMVFGRTQLSEAEFRRRVLERTKGSK